MNPRSRAYWTEVATWAVFVLAGVTWSFNALAFGG